MDMRRVGSSDLMVSALGLGCNNFGGRLDETGSAKVVHQALDAGVTLYDTADIYPMGNDGVSEKILGRALGARRKDVTIATKFGMRLAPGHKLLGGGGARDFIVGAVEGSLRQLGTGWIDLLHFHTPDPDTPIEETLRALDDLVQAGKVRYIGASNFAGWQIVEAEFLSQNNGLNRFIATQDHYSLLAREIAMELIPACEAYNVALLPFFPLASGILSGKYRLGEPAPDGTRLAKTPMLADMFLTEENLLLAGKLEQIARSHGKELIDLAFAWLLRTPLVPSVIAGASTPAQIIRNAQAVAWQLSDEVTAEVASVLG